MVTLESLIEEGNNIREGIKYIPPANGVIRLYEAYGLSDTKVYGTWKNKVIRYLDKYFPGDRCLADFEKAIADFEKHHCSPSLFDVVNGILVSCQEVDNDGEQSQESIIDKIYRLEADYEKRATALNGVNKVDTIKAFHDWYDVMLRYLGQFFDEKDAVFKRISNIQTGGNGHTLKFVYDNIKTNVHLLLDKTKKINSSAPTIITGPVPPIAKTNKIFIVHGHDDEMKLAVARLLEKLDFEPIILSEQADQGRTIIEKFEEESDVGFAVVLMSNEDDMGAEVGSSDYKPRARQNVILELGYFIGKLGRKNHVCVLKKGDVETPSDILGIVYKKYSSNDDGWKFSLAKELKAAGYSVDMNDVL